MSRIFHVILLYKYKISVCVVLQKNTIIYSCNGVTLDQLPLCRTQSAHPDNI